jgi:riboflavin biosynthesis pyrimidine reductase
MSTSLRGACSLALQPFEVLFEAPGLPAFELPSEVAGLYGGTLGFEPPRLYANFVASLDGVTAIPSLPASAHLIAAGSEHDRFLMGLLRACADVVLIGAGTLGGAPRANWTPENVYPPARDLYAELRRRRERPPRPVLAVLSGRGRIDMQPPKRGERTLVLTSQEAAAQLGDRLPRGVEIVPIGDRPRVDPVAAVEALRARRHELILCEGGPTLFGALVHGRLVDELFLTLSPRLAGRPAGQQRLSLLENAEPREDTVATLLSVRRTDSHLFLRYQLPRGDRQPSDGGSGL